MPNSKPDIKLIAAIDSKRGIAKHNKIPWELPADQKYFRQKLFEGPVVSGWKTFAANGFKPYGSGNNIVITRRDIVAAPGVWIVHNAKEYFASLKEDVWVAGGGQIFLEALPYATTLYLTRVDGDFICDTFFPEFTKDFELTNEQPMLQENGINFCYQTWNRKKLLS